MRKLMFTATFLVPAAASAGGYLVPSMDPRDLALGGAAVANQDGAGATFLNTAALAGQEGFSFGGALGFINNATDWSEPKFGPAGSASTNEKGTPPAVAVALGGLLPEGQAWGIGLGFGVPAGGTLNWPKGWAGQESIVSVKQQVFGFGGGAAFQLLPSLKIGINYSRLEATEELHQSLNYLDHFGDAGLGLAGGANTFGLGAEFRIPQVPLTFGVTYTHSAEIKLEGNAHFTEVPAAFQPMVHDQKVTEILLIPDVVYAGLAYEAMPGLKLMGSYSFEHFSDYKSDHFVGSDGFVADVPRNYDNAHVIAVGGEWKGIGVPMLTGRAGLVRSISDQPKDTVSPSLTDASSWAFSIGAGFDVIPNGALRLDAGLQYALFDEVTADPMSEEVFPGTYKTHVLLASFGVSGRFDLGLNRR